MILRFFGSNNPKGNNRIYNRCYECPSTLIMAEICGVPRSFERMGAIQPQSNMLSGKLFLSVKKKVFTLNMSLISRVGYLQGGSHGTMPSFLNTLLVEIISVLKACFHYDRWRSIFVFC